MICNYEKIQRILSPSVRITFLNYFFKFVFKFLLLIFVPLYLDSDDMGYWYTFISIAAMKTFADLGFTSIITQFTAHEIVKVHFNEKTRDFDDCDESIHAISSLFKFSVKWSGALTAICICVISLIGCLVFYKDGTNLYHWLVPWLIYAIASSFDFFNQVILAFFEGCNQIVTSQRIKIINAFVLNGLGVLGIVSGWGLYALSVPMLLGVLISFIQVGLYYHKAIWRMVISKSDCETNWLTDILKLLWRYAVSWISGYLIFQVYNPLIFSLYGAEAAGQIGYVMTIVSALVSIANVWSYVSVPRINILTECKEWGKLDSEYRKNMILIEVTFVIEVICCFVARYMPFIADFINKYLFSYKAFTILSAGYIIQLAVSYIGVYLRAHKEEPLMYISVFGAAVSIGMTLVCIKFFNLDLVFLGFLISEVVAFPFVLKIKRNRMNSLHNGD